MNASNLLSTSFLGTMLAVPVAAQGIKLSAPPGAAVVGDVSTARSSPDGEWVVYQADQEIDGVADLYSVPADGSRGPLRLDAPRGQVTWFALSPDSRTVAFLSDGALYSAAIEGGRLAVRLSPTPNPQYVFTYRGPQFSPDGRWLVYAAYVSGSSALFAVPLDGSLPPRRLNDALPRGGRLESFRIDEQGRRVVYAASRSQAYAFELYSVPLAEHSGRARPRPVRLSRPMPTGASVSLFQLTSDGSRVVYLADQETRGQNELFLVPIDGSAPPRKLNAALPRAGLDVEYDFAVSPDGARVLYRAPYSTTSSRQNLYSVPLDGSRAPVPLNAELERDGFGSFQIDPTSTRVVYHADQVDGAQGRELFVVPIDGSAPPRRLNRPLGEDGGIYTFQIDPAGEHALFVAVRELEDGSYVYELFRSELRRLSLVELGNGRLPNVASFQISPDSSRAVALTYDGLARELYSLALDHPDDPIPISGPPFKGVRGFSIAPRGGRVLFVADRDTLDAFELYTAPLDGRAEPRKLNGPLVTAPAAARSVHSFVLSPDGSRAAYFVNGCDDECDEYLPDELHVVSTDARGAPVQLYPPSVPGIVRLDDTSPFHLDRDGRRLVFAAGYPGCDGYGELMELYSAPTDGSLPPVRLNGPVESDDDVRWFALTPAGDEAVFIAASKLYRASVEGGVAPTALAPSLTVRSFTFSLSPDGALAVFLAAEGEEAAYELYGVPLDGSRPPVELGEPFPEGWSLLNVAFAGDRLVYRIGPYPWRSGTPSEIRSVPLDGSSGSILLGGPLVAGGDFTDLLVSPDGSRVVYLADQEVDERFELYSAPVDGSVGAVKLNGPLVAGGDVANQDYNGPRFAISADGSRVVYLADQEVDDQFQLFGAPIDGSAAPVKLSGTIAGNADVRSFQLDPTGTRAVYVADALTNTMFELFIVPVDGSAAPLRLNSPFADGGDVANPYNGQWSFQITPDGSAVLYVADQREDGVFELFGAPLDGRSSAYRLSAPLVRGGDVASFQASPDSRSVLYLADQDVNDLTELYMSFLIHDGPRGR